MAAIVLGIGTSHTPLLSLPPELWADYAQNDRANPELLAPPEATPMSYADLEARVSGRYAAVATPAHFHDQYARAQRAITSLEETLRAAAPDTVVIISDDQDEILFDDNMPSLAIYWGASMRVIPRQLPPTASAATRAAAWGYGDAEVDVPVDTALAQRLIERLIDDGFDVAHIRYLHDEYGGAIGPAGYLTRTRTTAPRRQGMPHGFSFVVRRIMNGAVRPIVPVFQNTCYPPNQPTPGRCYAFGRAIRAAIEGWDSDRRVAVVASGGLSHFVVDEEIDRMLLDGIARNDGALLSALPRHRLDSAASEIRNWITAAGALSHLDVRLLDYIAGYRTPAGTGGGWAFGVWS
ncbi:MAG: extradiol ring-cleavage dioxygenase [Dehalococcoidia bacterium]